MKYRLKAYDLANDIYLVQRKVLFFWVTSAKFGAGSKEKMTHLIRENDEKN